MYYTVLVPGNHAEQAAQMLSIVELIFYFKSLFCDILFQMSSNSNSSLQTYTEH